MNLPSSPSNFSYIAPPSRAFLAKGAFGFPRIRVAACCLAALAATQAGAQEATAENSAPSYLPKSPDVVKLDAITVQSEGDEAYAAKASVTATRTPTPLLNTPQAITVVTRELIDDQAMRSVGDLTRYVPGVGIAQGEGNRDTPVLRGNSTTADFFVDGVRDDMQFFRDFYNIDRVEVLKGPNAMIFGRGGSGGVLNRVTKRASLQPNNELSVSAGQWSQYRATLDTGLALSERVALRFNALHEDSESYRDDVTLRRTGVAPTAAFFLSAETQLHVSYEYFRDNRVADRGIPSFRGAPLAVDAATFFGDPNQSQSESEAHSFQAVLEHRFANGASLRNTSRFSRSDKFYQNVYPGSVNSAGTTVSLSAYNNTTLRDSWNNQTDLVLPFTAGGMSHTFLVGTEVAFQDNENLRLTGYFPTGSGGTTTSVSVPVAQPNVRIPTTYLPSATDANNTTEATTLAGYVQDQIEVTRWLQAIAGLRVERLRIDLTNRRTHTRIDSTDTPVSPRFGLVAKPHATVSLYASSSLSYVPRAGEQLASLTASNRSLAPEKFRNLEVGAKWDARKDLALTIAAYQLDRDNVAITDPADVTRMLLVNGQRAHGLELGFAGRLTPRWSVAGGYALQEGEIRANQSASIVKGARLAQLPRHSASWWNRFEVTDTLAFGVGLVHRDALFPSTDNAVRVPGFTRVDAALYYRLNEHVRAQLNVENVGGRDYYASAHNNNNITPGAPRSFRLTLVTNW
jgi:catecholate siderophore receptor